MPDNGISFFNLASKRMSWLSQSQKVVAENVANANTPGFKARKTEDFQQMLASGGASALRSTNSRHMSGAWAKDEAKVSQDTESWGQSTNGNTVILEQQSIKANEIADSYRLAADLYRKAHELLTLSVTGGR